MVVKLDKSEKFYIILYFSFSNYFGSRLFFNQAEIRKINRVSYYFSKYSVALKNWVIILCICIGIYLLLIPARIRYKNEIVKIKNKKIVMMITINNNHTK